MPSSYVIQNLHLVNVFMTAQLLTIGYKNRLQSIPFVKHNVRHETPASCPAICTSAPILGRNSFITSGSNPKSTVFVTSHRNSKYFKYCSVQGEIMSNLQFVRS